MTLQAALFPGFRLKNAPRAASSSAPSPIQSAYPMGSVSVALQKKKDQEATLFQYQSYQAQLNAPKGPDGSFVFFKDESDIHHFLHTFGLGPAAREEIMEVFPPLWHRGVSEYGIDRHVFLRGLRHLKLSQEECEAVMALFDPQSLFIARQKASQLVSPYFWPLHATHETISQSDAFKTPAAEPSLAKTLFAAVTGEIQLPKGLSREDQFHLSCVFPPLWDSPDFKGPRVDRLDFLMGLKLLSIPQELREDTMRQFNRYGTLEARRFAYHLLKNVLKTY